MSVTFPMLFNQLLGRKGLKTEARFESRPSSDCPIFDCSSVVFQPDSHVMYARHREASPIHYDPSFRSWVLLRHEDVMHVLKDDESFNKEYSRGFDQYMNSTVESERRSSKRCMKSSLVFDREEIVSWVEEWLDGFFSDKRAFDAVKDFGVQLPRMFTSRLLGLTKKEVQRIVDCLAVNRTDIGSSMGAVEQVLVGILEEIRKVPRNGVLSGLVHANPEQRLSDHQIIIMVRHLWFAGTVTLSTGLPAALLWLYRRPDLADELRRQPEKIPNFFSEVLRLESPTQFVPRVCVSDMDFHGMRFRKGDLVRISLASANRDPRVFKEPNSIDLTRQPYRNLAFGYGDHFCLGALHARTIAETALLRILNLSSHVMVVTPEHKIEYEKSLIFRAMMQMDVELQ